MLHNGLFEPAPGPVFDELIPKTLATATVDRLLHHPHVGQGDYRNNGSGALSVVVRLLDARPMKLKPWCEADRIVH